MPVAGFTAAAVLAVLPGPAAAAEPPALPGRPTLSRFLAAPESPAVTASLSARAVRVGDSVRVTGAVEQAPSGRWMRLERWIGGDWKRVKGKPLSERGTFAFTLTPGAPGWRSYRVVLAGDPAEQSRARLPWLDVFRLHRYVVRTRGDVRADVGVFRRSVAATYADARGWRRAHHRFDRVRTRGEFTVVLSEARYVPTYHPICSSMYSCRVGRHVIINETRWRTGSPYFPGPLHQYRRMVVNHETGHWLGRRHAFCRRSGSPAPVMQQQSKGLQGCRPNAWPLRWEIAAVQAH